MQKNCLHWDTVPTRWFLQKPLGMAVFIGIPVCTFVIGDVIRRRKQAQHSDEETARLREELERLKAASGSGAAPQ